MFALNTIRSHDSTPLVEAAKRGPVGVSACTGVCVGGGGGAGVGEEKFNVFSLPISSVRWLLMQPIGSPGPCTHMHNVPVPYMNYKSRVGCCIPDVHPSLFPHPQLTCPSLYLLICLLQLFSLQRY